MDQTEAVELIVTLKFIIIVGISILWEEIVKSWKTEELSIIKIKIVVHHLKLWNNL